MGGSLAVLADGILQAALDLSSLELVKRGSGRLQEFKLMPMPGVGQNHLGGTWERHAKWSTGRRNLRVEWDQSRSGRTEELAF